MHESIVSFIKKNRENILAPVLEVGSANVNGSIRGECPEPYTGVDLAPGAGVDVVVGEDDPLPFPDESFRTVISTSMLEHALDPVACLREMARVLSPGGLLLVTAAGNGFNRHNPPDRWRLMPGTLAEWGVRLGLNCQEEEDPQVSGRFLVAFRAG
ncbi:MAG: class I SAM-dependent methyltransferase [Gemmatimonadales bacterium]|nr:MAG: class I SAM-dependent methyltransferase [Gemmatimonadales bacterium]